MGSRKRKNKLSKTKNKILTLVLGAGFIFITLAGSELSFRKIRAEHLGELKIYDIEEKRLTIIDSNTQYEISLKWDEETKFLAEGTPSTDLSLTRGKEVNAKYHESLLTTPVADELCVHTALYKDNHK